MKDWEKFRAVNGWMRCRSIAWISYCGASLRRSDPALMALIYRRIRVFLSRIGIEDIRRRDIGGIYRRIVPVVVGWPCPKGSPGGPAEPPAATTPSESPSPVPAGPAPTPTAVPPTVPPTPVIAVPGRIAGDRAGTVERGGCGRTSNLSARGVAKECHRPSAIAAWVGTLADLAGMEEAPG
jgi:hypothetical protein